MTLHELAEASGVSVSMLSSVERGVKAPTVVVLDRIAHGLGVRIGALVAEPDDARVVVRRAAEQDVVDEPGGWRRTILAPAIPGVQTIAATRRRMLLATVASEALASSFAPAWATARSFAVFGFSTLARFCSAVATCARAAARSSSAAPRRTWPT